MFDCTSLGVHVQQSKASYLLLSHVRTFIHIVLRVKLH